MHETSDRRPGRQGQHAPPKHGKTPEPGNQPPKHYGKPAELGSSDDDFEDAAYALPKPVKTSRQFKAKKAQDTYEQKYFEMLKSKNPDVSEEFLKEVADLTSADERLHIEAGPTDDEWLNRITTVWNAKEKQNQGFYDALIQCFRSVQNPYATALYLIRNAKGFVGGKSSQPSFQILREFDKWIGVNKTKYQSLLSQRLRLEAFQLARVSFSMFDMIVRAFQLRHEGNNYMLPYIQAYVYRKMFKEVGSSFPYIYGIYIITSIDSYCLLCCDNLSETLQM